MTSTISTTEDTFTPILVNGYEASRASGNVIHNVLSSNTPAVTLRESRLRTGTLTALFGTLDLAQALETALTSGAVLYFYDTDHPTLALPFVCTGEVTVALDEDTRNAWTVEWEFQEVAT